MLINIAGKNESEPTNIKKQDIIPLPFSSLDTVSFNATNGQKLTIPTYDGTGEATHPDVMFFADKWNGYHYWMCMTPYFGGDNSVENPSVIVSNDGINWFEPSGISNPVVPPLGGDDHHSDTSFYFENDTLYMYWRTVYKPTDGSPNYETIFVKSSTDGVNWSSSKELMVVGFNEEGGAHVLSPVVVKMGDLYYLYTVNYKNDGTKVVQYRTAEVCDGEYNDPTDVTMNGIPSGIDPWHLNIYRYYNTLIMLYLARPHEDIFILTSTEYDSFTNPLGESPLLSISSTAGFDDTWLYQPSLVPTLINGKLGFDLYYSARSSENVWSIGITKLNVSTV